MVIGNGNVAADVARMLALTREELEETDTADHAIEAFNGAAASRRSSCSAAAGPPRPPSPTPRSASSARWPTRTSTSTPPRWSSTSSAASGSIPTTPIRPTAATSRSSPSSPSASRREEQEDRAALPPLPGRDPGRRQGRADRGRPQRAAAGRLGAIRAGDTGERETIECGLVLRSIGYLGNPDRRRALRRAAGRSRTSGPGPPTAASEVPGLYAVGWIKRGPSGVIGTNKKDAQETVDNLFADLKRGRSPSRAGRRPRRDRDPARPSASPTTSPSRAGRRSTPPRSRRGKPHGRPRVKFCRVEELVEASKATKAALALGSARLTPRSASQQAAPGRSPPARSSCGRSVVMQRAARRGPPRAARRR